MEIPASVILSSGIHAYVAVKASLHSNDTSVFGLDSIEVTALSQKFNTNCTPVMNGVMIKVPPMQVINALGQLGYKVVTTTGEAENVWTLQREVYQN